MTKSRIVFVGTGNVAAESLRALYKVADILLVISQPPRPIGKKQELKPTAIMQMASELALPLATPEKIEDCNKQIAALLPDVMVVVDYGQIIKTSTLNLPKLGALNLHPSLLPRHRGPAPVPATILAGDDNAGITIIKMDDKMDHGPIVTQKNYPLTGVEKTVDLLAFLAKEQAALVAKVLPEYCEGKLKLEEQDHTLATSHSFLSRADGELRPNETTIQTYRRFRALFPWPGIWLKKQIRGEEKIIKLLDISLWPNFISKSVVGSFIWHEDKLGLVVTDGVLQIREIQVEGGKPQTGKEFYSGYHNLVS